MFKELIESSWQEVLKSEFSKEYFKKLEMFLIDEFSTKTIFPPKEKIFTALNLTPYEKIKVVILGQDPYHDKNQAQGLAFSVPISQKIPPSLRNIFKEFFTDLQLFEPSCGDLTHWAEQGVFLLNTVLTVEAHKANSHKNRGWEIFTDAIIARINESKNPVIFVLWGSQAQKKESLITSLHHKILKAPHPSPLSAWQGFFGSKPFSQVNNFLISQNILPIIW